MCVCAITHVRHLIEVSFNLEINLIVLFILSAVFNIMKASILALIVIQRIEHDGMAEKELYNGIIKRWKKHDTVVTLSNKQPALRDCWKVTKRQKEIFSLSLAVSCLSHRVLICHIMNLFIRDSACST